MTAPNYDEQITRAVDVREEVAEVATRHILNCPLCHSSERSEQLACETGLELAEDLNDINRLIIFWTEKQQRRAFLTVVTDHSA